jgi:hypothetical protein
VLQPSALKKISSQDLRKEGEHKKTMKNALMLKKENGISR